MDKVIRPLSSTIDEAMTGPSNEQEDDLSDAQSFDSDEFDAELDAKLANMTEEELDRFLAENDEDDEDSDSDSDGDLEEAKTESHPVHQDEKTLLQLRFGLIKDCMTRIEACISHNVSSGNSG